MAAKVNVKFVVLLGAALTLVLAGMALVFFFVLKKSGEDWARRGDEAMAAQDYEAADQAYSFAVAHDRQNVEWLKKWLTAMESRVIENQIDFEDRFRQYRGVVRQIAHMGRTADLGAHENYLDMVLGSVSGATDSQYWRSLLTEARASQAFYDGGTVPEPGAGEVQEWHRLYRYSGIALSTLFALNLTENEDEVVQAERDLRLAVAAAPSDAEAVLELSNLYLLHSDRRRTTPPVDLAASERFLQQGRAVLAEALDRDPTNVDAAIGLLRLDVVQAQREFGARLSGQRPTREMVDAMLAPFAPRVEAIAAELRGRVGAGIPSTTLERFAQVERVATPRDEMSRMAGLVESSAAAHPNDVDYVVMLGNVRMARREYPEAIAAMQRLIDLPAMAIGQDGWVLLNSRSAARLVQAQAALSEYENAPAGAEGDAARASAMAEAKRYREALSTLVAADAPQLLKIDARMAFLEGRAQDAERLLITVNERTGGSDQEVLWWLAQTEMGLGKLGEARRLLERLDELQPDEPRYLVALAAIALDLRDTERARAIAAELTSLFPGEPQVEEVVGRILGANDPNRAVLDEYRRLAEGEGGVLGDQDAAIAYLEGKFEANGRDPRLGEALLQARLMRQDVPGALSVVERVLESHPDQSGFERIRAALSRGEFVPALVELIATGPGTDAQKAMQTYAVYVQNGMSAEGSAALAAAARTAPNAPEVIEMLFNDALLRQDVAALAPLVARAREHNTDGMEGETYALRALIAEGKHREAVTLGERLVTRSPNDAGLWYMLGLERVQVGRLDDAETALRRAIQIRPNDVRASMELSNLLAARGRDQDALQVARAAEAFGRGNVQFMNMVWILEARVGDRQKALLGREDLRRRDPGLLWNNATLAELYMDLGRWPEARTLIDEMRAGQDSLGLVGLDARWHADQGDFDGASAAYTAYIAKIPAGEVNTDPFLAWADFMQSREQLSRAEAALTLARVHQSPETMDADRMLGDLLTLGQRLGEAAEAYGRVVAGNADTPDFMFRKRLVEALVNLERYDEARQNLAAMSSIATTDRNVLLLTAELERKAGNRAEASRRLDECVRLFPDDPVVYYQRAEFLLDDETRLMDALADFDTAIRKAPMFWQALRNRSGVYRRLGRMDEAVADLRAAVVAAGTDGEAITQMLGEMMYLRRAAEAVSAADEAVAARPTDVVFIQRVAGVFAARSEWAAASRFAARAFELRKEAAVAQRYLDTLLNQRPPQTRMAEDVLNSMGREVVSHPGLLAASVMVHVQRSRVAEAERDATAAFDLVSADPDRLVAWHTTMTRAFGDSAGYQAYLRRLAAAKAVTPLKDWPLLFLAMSQARDNTTSAMAIESLNTLANTGEPVQVRLFAMRSIGTTVYGYGDHSQAVEIWRTALQAFPNDWEMNNNLAYALTEHMGRAEEALPYALKALEFQRRSSSVNDTLGWTYFKTGNHDKAMEHLWTAARLSRDAAEQASVVRHIIEVEHSVGNKASASRWLTYLDRLVAESPWLDESFRASAVEWREKIDSLP